MSLSARDRHCLDWIEAELSASEPKLAGMFAAFTALASGEDMPGPETVRSGIFHRVFRRRRGARPPHRRAGRRGSS